MHLLLAAVFRGAQPTFVEAARDSRTPQVPALFESLEYVQKKSTQQQSPMAFTPFFRSTQIPILICSHPKRGLGGYVPRRCDSSHDCEPESHRRTHS